MNNAKTKLLVPADQVKGLEQLNQIAKAVQDAAKPDLSKEVTEELRKEFKPIYCKECSELWEDCLCPKHEQPELCPEPWMRRV